MKVQVIKIGGNVIDDPKALDSFLRDFSRLSGLRVLVHGGGKIATEISRQLGVESKMVEGRRITDSDSLRIVQMVYAGLINKNLVARLQSLKCNAIGLTGADAGTVLAGKRPPMTLSDKSTLDYGWVGDVKRVNSKAIFSLLKSGFVPVIAPLTHDGKGQILNTNADTMASALAVGLARGASVELVYCFEKSGVLRDLNDESSVIPSISRRDYPGLKQQGVIFKGMIPKLDNAFDAIGKGVKSVRIVHARDMRKSTAGTKLEK